MRVTTLAAASLLAAAISTSGPAAQAQSATEHQGHHPEQNAAPATPPSTQPAQPAMGGAQGGTMMGGGMMNMMAKMPMRDMQSMGMMGEGSGISGMETIDHVEGRIAFLRAELKITDAQTTAWNAFADALRANAKALGEVRAAMKTAPGAAPQSLADRLSLQEKWLAARLEGVRAIRTALVALAGTFSDEQKKAADELLAPHIGMMPMMTGMPGGMMGMAR